MYGNEGRANRDQISPEFRPLAHPVIQWAGLRSAFRVKGTEPGGPGPSRLQGLLPFGEGRNMVKDGWAIETKDITWRFGDLTAVDRLNLAVPAGVIFGFLGPNGAGKSTTINMLVGLLQPTSGSATVAGFSIDQAPLEVKKRIGVGRCCPSPRRCSGVPSWASCGAVRC
jgi:ABC-type multidrug transport system fused ATPase/permease subunit